MLGFIGDLSRIFLRLPLLYVLYLQKDALFDFNEDCRRAFDQLKLKLTTTPIVQPPNWALPLMCDPSDKAVEAVLGQRVGKVLDVIYYTSRTLDLAQYSYTTTEKQMYAVIFAQEKFRPFLLGAKVALFILIILLLNIC